MTLNSLSNQSFTEQRKTHTGTLYTIAYFMRVVEVYSCILLAAVAAWFVFAIMLIITRMS